MKKYIVFAYLDGPCGGLDDIYDSYDSFEEAKEWYEKLSFGHEDVGSVSCDNVEIIDRDTWEKVE